MGNEFGSVEALWSQFENFMGRPGDETEAQERQKSGHQDVDHSQLHEQEMGDGEDR